MHQAAKTAAVGVPGSFNFADIWEMAADAVPEREALVVGDQRRTYAQLEDRANRLANHLAARGVGSGEHVALYLENSPEYVEAMLALFKLRAVPINVNYRYVADELHYLLANSDSVAVLTQPSLRPTVDAVLDSTSTSAVGSKGSGQGGLAQGGVSREGVAWGELARRDLRVRFALSTGDEYEAVLAAASAQRPAIERSGADHYVIYTGGTTGLPKGVAWRQEDAFFACIGGGDPLRTDGPAAHPSQLPARIVDQPLCYLPVAPMMHAAAQWTTFSWLFCGSKVVLMPGSLDPAAVWRAVQAEAVNIITVVGDAVARPLLDEWDAAAVAEAAATAADSGSDSGSGVRGGSYDAGSLFVFSSGGAPMSLATKQRVFASLPHVLLADGFGSSEAGTQGSSRVSAAEVAESGSSRLACFDLPAKPTIVVDTDGNEVVAGSGLVGQVLAGGRLPLGYYNDPERTAATFVERDGERWLVTGDMATVEADGSIALVGRGAGAINTGGEKVFPEEVEGVLKAHPAVYDCVVVGVDDERWGSAVSAVVQPVSGAVATLDDLVAHCKERMAGYKAPKRLVIVDRIERSPSGKADYRWAREIASGSTQIAR